MYKMNGNYKNVHYKYVLNNQIPFKDKFVQNKNVNDF